MKACSIIIASLYDHFYKMRGRGRPVSPSLQTIFTLSLSLSFMIILVIKILLDATHNGYYQLGLEEWKFLLVYVVLLLTINVLIYKIYFQTDRHLAIYEQFLDYSETRRKRYKFLTLFLLVGTVFLEYGVIYWDAVKFK